MKEKIKIQERLKKEIFINCKKENRNPDQGEIAILSNIEEQQLSDKLTPNLNKLLQEKH
jgi:hypothetical protein